MRRIMKSKQKLTKTLVDGIPFSEDKQLIVWDTQLVGFGILIGKTKKSYIAQANVHGKSRRITIGPHGVLVPETARPMAQRQLTEMLNGVDPVQKKRENKQKSKSLGDVFKNYMQEKSGQLSKGTQNNYRSFINVQLKDWLAKPLNQITTDMVFAKYSSIIEAGKKTTARGAFKFLQTLFNYAQIDNDKLVDPVKILDKKKVWSKKVRKDSYIKDHQLPAWYAALMNVDNHSFRDALRMLLFTGMRKNEVFSMKWEYVDFEDRTFTIPDTKNGKPLILPLNEFLYDLLNKRKAVAGNSIWVFPGNGTAGHITEAKKVLNAITNQSKVVFTLHDLRRTFLTMANSLSISQYVLKKLVNHSQSGDVTSGYIKVEMKLLREASRLIEDKVLELIQVQKK
jgi:integrase